MSPVTPAKVATSASVTVRRCVTKDSPTLKSSKNFDISLLFSRVPDTRWRPVGACLLGPA